MKLANPNLSRAVMASVAACVMLCGGGIWWSLQQKAQADQAGRRLKMQTVQWQALVAADPAPTAAVVAGLERQLDTARRAVGALRRELGESSQDPVQQAEPPAARADAFFALAQFMESQTEQARAADVILADGETFGFSAHRNSGPADVHIGLVHQQMTAVTAALQALWRAQPEELLGVQRETPRAKLGAADGVGSPPLREARPDEWMDWPPGRSLARDGILDTLALRFSWVGHTASLRAWLAEIRRGEAPLIVRQIEVEPLAEGGRPAGGRRTLADLFRDTETELPPAEEGQSSIVPLIAENRSVFHVTLEYLDFTPRPVAAPEEEIW